MSKCCIVLRKPYLSLLHYKFLPLRIQCRLKNYFATDLTKKNQILIQMILSKWNIFGMETALFIFQDWTRSSSMWAHWSYLKPRWINSRMKRTDHSIKYTETICCCCCSCCKCALCSSSSFFFSFHFHPILCLSDILIFYS